MSRKPPTLNRQTLEEACAWFVTFRTGTVEASARQDFHDWLKRSPEHIRAYLEITSTYADIPPPANGRTPPELIARARSSSDINIASLVADGSAAHPPRTATNWPILPWAIAMVALLVVGSVGAWIYSERNTYRTAIGEQRSLTLSDGSIVELNARSKIRVVYGPAGRDVELLSGQALFRVAKDSARPFIVTTDNARVRAVGTQFDVYRKPIGTTVTVLEGRVSVLPENGAGNPSTNPKTRSAHPASRVHPRPDTTAGTAAILADNSDDVLLSAGEQATVTGTSAERNASPNVTAATAWTRHQLVFDGTPLRDVIEEFSRYSPHRLVIDSPELADLKISGQYISADPQSLLRFLSLQTGVTITDTNGETHIRRE